MSNVFQSISSGTGLLKNFYQGPIVDQFNEDVAIYRAAEKIKNAYTGFQVNRPLRLNRNTGIGASTDGGILPSIGRQTVVQATISAKFNWCRFGITAGMIKASAADAGSFVRDAAYELEQSYGDLKSDVNRQLSWDGSGTLATTNTAAVASTTLIIAGRESTEPALKFILPTMIVDIYDSTGATLKASGVTINSISSGTGSSATATLILDTPVTSAVGDIMVRTNSKGNEIQGLLYPLDGGTSTIYGIDRSTYIQYQGNVTTVSAQLNLAVMQTAYNEGMRRGNAKYNAIWTDYTSLGYYQKLLTPDKRYVNSMQGDGTFGKKSEFYLEFMGLSVVPDKDCPTRIFFLPSEVLKNYSLCDLEFADETGSQFIAQTSTDSFETRIRLFSNLFNEQPAACAVLKTYTSP